jgi:hypothetical protein
MSSIIPKLKQVFVKKKKKKVPTTEYKLATAGKQQSRAYFE